MVTDLVEIRRLAESKQAENLEFRRYVAAHHLRPEPFHILAAALSNQIDCKACANCCRYTVVGVSDAEIRGIARYLQVDSSDVVRLYTVADPDDSQRRNLLNVNDACVFLEGNLCMIYEARPAACRDFPHTALDHGSLGARMSSMHRHACLCPIIYNAVEDYKHLVGYKPSAVDKGDRRR